MPKQSEGNNHTSEINVLMQRKNVFCIISRVFGNISKSGNIWDGEFFRTWTVKLILLAHDFFSTRGLE